MRGRFAVPVALLATVALPASGQAAGHKHPGHAGQKVSINVTPNPVVTGTPLAIYGQLNAADVSDRPIVLWHRIAGQNRFTVISRTKTDGTGFYRFNRAEGIVRTNRNWYVRAAGARSRTLHEHVYSEITLAEPTSPALTGHAVSFAGAVTPGGVHAGDRIYLQQQLGADGDNWRTVDHARVGANGAYAISHRFPHPGTKAMRVVLPGDRFNIRTATTPVTVNVEQAQKAGFTIGAGSDAIDAGKSVSISGTLAPPNNSGATLTLFAREQTGGGFHAVGTTSTDGSGNYSFTESPIHNTVYQVRTGAGRRTALLYEGVRDVVTVTPSTTTAHVNDVVSFSGSVLPNKQGHAIYLEAKGDDGAYHIVQVRHVQPGSTYTLTHKMATTGTKVFRVIIPGGPSNARGVTGPVEITVS